MRTEMKAVVSILLMLVLISASTVNQRPVLAVDKDDVEFWMALGAGFFSALLIVATWMFGGCLEISMYIHLAAIHVSNDITVASYKTDPDYTASVVPSDLTLSRSQTDSPDFSESLNELGNEAINAVLNSTSLCLALASSTNRYYTAQAAGQAESMKKQLKDIQTLHSSLMLAEDDAAWKLETFATALATESPDPTATKQQFVDFQNMVATSGFPPEEVDLLNSLVSRADPILFDEFGYLDYLENMAVSVECPYSELSASNATLETAKGIQHTSEVIGPFPTPSVGGVWVPVDKLSLLAPYIALASTILVATAATAIYVKRVKRRKEKQ